LFFLKHDTEYNPSSDLTSKPINYLQMAYLSNGGYFCSYGYNVFSDETKKENIENINYFDEIKNDFMKI